MATSSTSWSAIFRKGWQLTGQNVWVYAAFLAVQLGAWFVFSPTVTSFSFSLDTSGMEYGLAPAPGFDFSTSSIDGLYMVLSLFISLLGAGFALSAARGRASLDEALRWNAERLWNMAWLCAIVCGAFVLGFGVLAVVFGSAFLSSALTVALTLSGSVVSIDSVVGAVSTIFWPFIGVLMACITAVTVALAWLFAPFYVIDGTAPVAALQKSWRSTHGHRWQLFFLHVVPMAVAMFCLLLGALLTVLVAYLGVPFLTGIFGLAFGLGVVAAAVLAGGTSFFGTAALYTAIGKK